MFAHRGSNIDPDTGTLVPSIAFGMGRTEQANTSGYPGQIYMIMGDGRRYNKTMAGNYCPYEGLCFNDYGDIVLVRDNYDYVVIEEAARSVAGASHPSGWSSKAFYRANSGTRYPFPMVKRYQNNGEIFAPATLPVAPLKYNSLLLTVLSVSDIKVTTILSISKAVIPPPAEPISKTVPSAVINPVS